jgi:hypothetical protein
LAAWLVTNQAMVCDRVSRLAQDWYAGLRTTWVVPRPNYPDGLPFLPPSGDPFLTDPLFRVGNVHLAPDASLIGLVVPFALFRGQPLGVRITDLTEFELLDECWAFVCDE